VLVSYRIAEDASRALAPLRGPKLAGDRDAGGQAYARRAESAVSGETTARFAERDIELLGPRGGGTGRPVVSVPFSAFFAQHLGQHPDVRDSGEEHFLADVAYRDALDLGVALDRPMPISIAV